MLGAGCLGVFAVVLALNAPVGHSGNSTLPPALRASVIQADSLYQAGDIDGAIAEYERAYPGAGVVQGEVLTRIVEHKIKKGQRAAAIDWINKGLDAGWAITYESEAARQLDLEARRQRAERQRERDQRSGLSMENYQKIRSGMTLKEVEEILRGGADEAALSSGQTVFVWKTHGPAARVVQVYVLNGRVVAKAQQGLSGKP